MRKYRCLLMVILLLVSMAGAAIAENKEYTYLAVLFRYTDYETITHIGQLKPVDISRLDLHRAVTAHIVSNSTPVPLMLPDGSDWEEYNTYIGARVTFDKPFDTIVDRNGLAVVLIPDGVILEPKRVEFVGDVKYGKIIEFDVDYIVHDVFSEREQRYGDNNCYTITPDTLIRYEEPFQPGDGYQIIVDNEGVVLAMIQSNG